MCGVWIWGLRGSGKSTFAHEIHEDIYKRIPADFAWSNYNREEVILYDDVDHDTASIKNFTQELKHVADKWPFPKRDLYKKQEMFRPKACIVTSQYTINQLWFREKEAKEALARRFWTVEAVANPRTYKVVGPEMDDETQTVTIFDNQSEAMKFLREKVGLDVESVKKAKFE